HSSPPLLSPLSLHDALPIFRTIILSLTGVPGAGRRNLRPVAVRRPHVLIAEQLGVAAHGAGGVIVAFIISLVRVINVVDPIQRRSEEHTSELQSRFDLVCRL